MENRFNCLHISTSYNSFLCTPLSCGFCGKGRREQGKGVWVMGDLLLVACTLAWVMIYFY